MFNNNQHKIADMTQLQSYMHNVVGSFVDKFILHFVHSISHLSTSASPQHSEQPEDHIFNYTSSVIGLGLLARNFHDASREADGLRLIRCWEFFLLHFKVEGCTKYALEAFILIAQTSTLLTPRMAHQLIWNRTCNPRGGNAGNVQLDLHNEHLSRVFKDNINTFRPHITQRSVERSSQSMGPLIKFLAAVDNQLHVCTASGQHSLPSSEEDFKVVVRLLKHEKVFHWEQRGYHESFKSLSADPFVALKGGRTWQPCGYYGMLPLVALAFDHGREYHYFPAHV